MNLHLYYSILSGISSYLEIYSSHNVSFMVLITKNIFLFLLNDVTKEEVPVVSELLSRALRIPSISGHSPHFAFKFCPLKY